MQDLIKLISKSAVFKLDFNGLKIINKYQVMKFDITDCLVEITRVLINERVKCLKKYSFTLRV